MAWSQESRNRAVNSEEEGKGVECAVCMDIEVSGMMDLTHRREWSIHTWAERWSTNRQEDGIGETRRREMVSWRTRRI